MHICDDIYNVPKELQNTVLVIGNFDGVHLGHKYLLAQAKNVADALGAKLAVMTFYPHPAIMFKAVTEEFLLITEDEKYQLLQNLGVEIIFVVNFDEKFKNISADDFINQILEENLAIKHLFVGDDFTFGSNRSGNIAKLEQAANLKKFAFTPVNRLKINNNIVSSTLIRGFLDKGDFQAVEQYLGRKL